MYFVSPSEVLEIYFKGLITGIGLSILVAITFIAYKSYEKKELKKRKTSKSRSR